MNPLHAKRVKTINLGLNSVWNVWSFYMNGLAVGTVLSVVESLIVRKLSFYISSTV